VAYNLDFSGALVQTDKIRARTGEIGSFYTGGTPGSSLDIGVENGVNAAGVRIFSSGAGDVRLAANRSASGGHASLGTINNSDLTIGRNNAEFLRLDANGIRLLKMLQETIVAHGAMGAAEDFAFSAGSVHTGTLDANCTFTFSGAVTGFGCSLTLFLTQDGTGGRTVTFPASVKWPGGVVPALNVGAGKLSILSFLTIDGGTTIQGFLGGDDLR
jgi:hypothetical protein